MKKVIFALFGAIAMTLIPMNVNATTQEVDENGNCYINVAAGESATIDYDTRNCYVTNYGNLTINNGASIVKLSRYDEYGAINNYGNITMNGGYVEAHSGYGIQHKAGSVVVNGGTIYAPLHQVIWAKANTTTRINGGYFRSAIGGEEAIFTNGTLTICGGTFTSPVIYYEKNAKIDNSSCPVAETKSEPVVEKSIAPVENVAPKVEEKPVEQTTNTTAKSTPKVAVAEEKPAETPVETPAEPETKEELAAKETVEETTPTETETAKQQPIYVTPSDKKVEGSNQGLIITIIAVAMLGVASAGALFIIRH